MQKGGSQNYYEILDIPVGATSEDIERSYKLTKKALSDSSLAVYSLFDSDETKVMLEKIEEAYSVLSSVQARKRYDTEVLGFTNIHEQKHSSDFVNNAPKDYQAVNNMDTEQGERVQKKPIFFDSHLTEYRSTEILKEKPKGFVYDKKFEDEINKTEKFTGEFLKKVREYRAVSIEDIYLATKINPDYLMAIEEVACKKLPARVYLIGFLKQYSSFLKLDSKKVVESYLRLLEEAKNV